MNNVVRRFCSSWYSTLILAFATAAVLVVSDARTNDRSQITGQPAGLNRPEASAVGAPSTPPEGPEIADASALDVAQWKDGDLLLPLPSDPKVRQEALDQALTNAMARPRTGGVVHSEGGPVSGEAVAGSRSTNDPLPAVTPYIPPDVRAGAVTWNLKLPDKFVADPDVLRGIDPATGAPLAVKVQEAALVQALTPDPTKYWNGIGQTNLRPPDPDVAAGPDHIVAVVNARFAFYDKCGNNLFESDFATFMGDAVNFYFDPKVIYDPFDGRWIMTICVRNNTTHGSWVLLMTSDDSNPVGYWCWYYMDFTTNAGTPNGLWADYQDVGVSPNAIIITANMFNWAVPAAFQYSKVKNFDKAAAYACTGVCGWDFWGLTNPGDGSLAFSIRACDMNSWPGEYLLVNSLSYGGSLLTVWRLVGSPCSSPTLTSYNLPVGFYDDPPPMQQPNLTYVDCGDSRLMNAAYYGGDLWTALAGRYNFGEPMDRSVIWAYQLQPFAMTLSFNGGYGVVGAYLAYPTITFDPTYNGVFTFSFGSTSQFASAAYSQLNDDGPFHSVLWIYFGSDNYNDLVNAGTIGNPFRWGDYYGCDLDPFDNRTVWMSGERVASATTWGTVIHATAVAGPAVLSVTPSPGVVSGGFAGGPFNPNGASYVVQNTGGSALTWSLYGVDFWNTASSLGGQLGPGDATIVTVSINGFANGFGPGFYYDDYAFEACWVGTEYRSTELHIGVDGSCNGSELSLIPPGAPGGPYVDAYDVDRGVFVTAIKDFDLCAVGYKMDLATLPAILEARVYAATGSTRGALLASNSIYAAQLADVVQYVPLNYTLQACEDYEIVMVVPGGAGWEAWYEPGIVEPFDVGGVIRVRDGSAVNGAPNTLLAHFELIGSAPAATTVTDLGGPGAPPLPAPDTFQERGVFVRMLDTAQLCSFGWEADLVPGQTLTARVYESSGLVRGAVIAEGTYDVTSGGTMWHDIPINVQLIEGREYDLAITFGLTNNWQWWDENTFPMPFPADVFEVITSEEGGWGGNYALPHYRAGWDTKTGGAPFDLAKLTDVFPPPNSTSFSNSEYGAFVTSEIDQQVYSLGWMADVPAGQPIIARVYEAVGTTRGALISQGTAYSSGSGMRWHDIPVAAELASGVDYDIAIEFATVNEWLWWDDLGGMPYTSYGVLTVRDSENLGYAGNYALLHMRFHGCDALLTPVEYDRPARTPMFLAIPAPNPVTSSSRLDFAMEEAGPVSIVVYDVAGRRVATLLEGQRPKGWNTVQLDSSQMASGVYFLKMQTSMKAVSRKFVVTH
jgi:Secretion system C-terminal sorting domain